MPRDFSEEQLIDSSAAAKPRPLSLKSAEPVPALESDAVLQILTTGRAFVAAGWCCFPFSVDADGNNNYIDLAEGNAILRGVQFCADGALWRAYHVHDKKIAPLREAQECLDIIALGEGFSSRIHLNAERGQEAAVSMYDRAISARRSALRESRGR